MTTDEFLRLHGDESGIELVAGKVVEVPGNGCRHGEVCATAAGLISDVVVRENLGRMATNHTFVVTGPTSCRGADVLFVSYAVMPATVRTPAGALTPPLELVVEVRSPSDTIAEMTNKAHEYLNAGVQVVLVLDPQTDTATVHRLNELPQRFNNGDVVTLPEVSPTFAVPASRFFE